MKPQITLASACVAIAIICVGAGAAVEWGGGVGALALVTDLGVQRLKQALPKVQIVR